MALLQKEKNFAAFFTFSGKIMFNNDDATL